MDINGLLLELYGRIPPLARRATTGLDVAELMWRPGPEANPIGWLVWHAARVQDHHMAEILNGPQIWAGDGWSARFGLDPDPSNIGYGHSPDEVAQVQPAGDDDLMAYLDVVHDRSCALLSRLQPDELDRIVDRRWDPPVTLAVRLVSIADDSLQHMGQAAYVRGLLAERQGAI
jgi:hypothetical protein